MNKTLTQYAYSCGAFKVNVSHPFSYASGLKGPLYCDNRLYLGFPEVRSHLFRALSELISPENKSLPIVGVATGGIAYATGVAELKRLPLGYIRPKKKEHGSSRVLEGLNTEQCNEGIVLVEDLINQGSSLVKVLDTLAQSQIHVRQILCIVNYETPQGRKNLSSFPISALMTLTDLLKFAEQEETLTSDEIQVVQEWSLDPAKWSPN